MQELTALRMKVYLHEIGLLALLVATYINNAGKSESQDYWWIKAVENCLHVLCQKRITIFIGVPVAIFLAFIDNVGKNLPCW